jgi:transcriptional regulator with XRE-family HTH domain
MYGRDGAVEMDVARLARAVRGRRGTLNMTQPDLAERASVSLAYVYMLEAGGLPRPGLEPLRRVATVLGQARLIELLDEVKALSAEAPLSESVEEIATADAVNRFLRESRA